MERGTEMFHKKEIDIHAGIYVFVSNTGDLVKYRNLAQVDKYVLSKNINVMNKKLTLDLQKSYYREVMI